MLHGHNFRLTSIEVSTTTKAAPVLLLAFPHLIDGASSNLVRCSSMTQRGCCLQIRLAVFE
eukprot:161576-Amphidinium_carterae.1